MSFICQHCGEEKKTLNGLCSGCNKFSQIEPKEPSKEARLAAFKILERHPSCLRQNVILNDLIDDIAQAIDLVNA